MSLPSSKKKKENEEEEGKHPQIHKLVKS